MNWARFLVQYCRNLLVLAYFPTRFHQMRLKGDSTQQVLGLSLRLRQIEKPWFLTSIKKTPPLQRCSKHIQPYGQGCESGADLLLQFEVFFRAAKGILQFMVLLNVVLSRKPLNLCSSSCQRAQCVDFEISSDYKCFWLLMPFSTQLQYLKLIQHCLDCLQHGCCFQDSVAIMLMVSE